MHAFPVSWADIRPQVQPWATSVLGRSGPDLIPLVGSDVFVGPLLVLVCGEIGSGSWSPFRAGHSHRWAAW